jgi:hypothetical protein
MRAFTRCRLASAVVVLGLVLSAGVAAAYSPPWLTEINQYRAATGLAPVVENPAWAAGLAHHLTYLENTPAQYRTGAFASAHTENPASPYHTSDGATEAGYSDLALGGATTPLRAVDTWLAAPFHAIGMLRSQLSQVALAVDSAKGFAGLDVIQGIDATKPAATTPILFPGPGITSGLTTFGGESPDPRETCEWQNLDPVGLPLVVLLPSAPAAGASASLSGPDGVETTAGGTLCVVDASTYHSSDPVYGSNGASILESDNAVLLIPRRPLATGIYSADLQQPGQPSVAWSFSVKAPVPPPCPLCVSQATPAALSVPARVRAGRSIPLAFAAWRRFSVKATVWSARGQLLDSETFRGLKAERWNFGVKLPRRASRAGTRVLVTMRFTIGSTHIVLRRHVRFY